MMTGSTKHLRTEAEQGQKKGKKRQNKTGKDTETEASPGKKTLKYLVGFSEQSQTNTHILF